jgi:hypothetical protein
MVETDVKAYLRKMSQQQWDEWISGRISVAAIVENYRSLINLLGYRGRILEGIRGQNGESILLMIENERADLRIKSRDAARQRIDQELAQVRRLLS